MKHPKFVWNTGGFSVGTRIPGQGARTNFSGAPKYEERGSVSLQCGSWAELGYVQWSAAPGQGVWGRTLSVLGSRVWHFGVMWRYRSHDHFFTPYAISYWWSFGTKPLFLTVFEIFNMECNAMVDMTLIRPLNKGQGHLVRYQSISHIRLPIGCQ